MTNDGRRFARQMKKLGRDLERSFSDFDEGYDADSYNGSRPHGRRRRSAPIEPTAGDGNGRRNARGLGGSSRQDRRSIPMSQLGGDETWEPPAEAVSRQRAAAEKLAEEEASAGRYLPTRYTGHRLSSSNLEAQLAYRRAFAEKDERDARYPRLASRLKELAGRRIVPSRYYLRLGPPPPRGRSSIVGGFEEGVSVFPGIRLADGNFIVNLRIEHLRPSVVWLFAFEDREAFVVGGTQVGKGGDGEPVLDVIDSFEPFPKEAIVAAYPASAAIEDWNERRGGPLEDRVPGLTAWREA